MQTSAKKTVSFQKRKGGVLSGILFSLFISALLCLLLLSLSAVLLSRTGDPSRWIRPLGCGISALCVFLGGVLSGRRKGSLGALSGLLHGLLYVLLLFLVGLFAGDGQSIGVKLVCYTVLILLSVLGGVASASGGKRRKTHRRHR